MAPRCPKGRVVPNLSETWSVGSLVVVIVVVGLAGLVGGGAIRGRAGDGERGAGEDLNLI